MKTTCRVLLIDDDEDEYVLLKDVFARLPVRNWTLEWCSNYETALEMCAPDQVDVVLVDYYLGPYNGLDLMRAAVEHGCTAPFILLTGQSSYELDLTAMQQGVADYLVKDQINEYMLERSIRYALERAEVQQELERRVEERTRALAETNDELKREMARREQVEATLRESEERFRTLAETTSAAILIVQERVIRYANQAASFLTGFPAAELVGREAWTLAHPAYQAPFKADRVAGQWASNIPARYEIKFHTSSGEDRWADVTAGNMLYHGRPALLFTAFDISARDAAEQALKKIKG